MAQKALNIASAAVLALLVAAPTTAYAQTTPTAPATTNARDAMDADVDRDGDSEFPWGILGLLGLAGLLGLRGRDRDRIDVRRT